MAQRFDAAGNVTAWVKLEIPDLPEPHWAPSFWIGGIEAPRRRLWSGCQDAIAAMWAVEQGEKRGPLSDAWLDEPGVPSGDIPEFDGWTHELRKGRHVWHRRTTEGKLLAVYQLPPVRFSPHLRFMIWDGTDHLSRDGTPLVFDNPSDALIEAEEQFVLATSDVLRDPAIVMEKV
jgi:hypothetical protein